MTEQAPLQPPHRPELPQRRPRLPASYVGLWAGVGLASIAYLAVAITQPGLMGAGADTGPQPSLPVIAQRDATGRPPDAPVPDPEAQARIDQLHRQMEIARQRTEMSRLKEQEEARRRSETLPPVPALADPATETASATSPTVASPPPAGPTIHIVKTVPAGPSGPAAPPDLPQTQPSAVPPLGAEQPEVALVGTVPPEPTAAAPEQVALAPTKGADVTVPPPPDRAPPPPANIITGSLPKPPARTAIAPPASPPAAKAKPPAAPVAFGPAEVKPEPSEPVPTVMGVHLATGASVETLRLIWNGMVARHGPALAGFQPRYVMSGNDPVLGQTFALIAGPVTGPADIARACEAAIARGLTCRTEPYAGNAL